MAPLTGRIDAKLKVIDTRREYKVIIHHQGQSAITEFRRLKVLKRQPQVPGRLDTHQPDPTSNPVIGNQEEVELYSLLEVCYCLMCAL